MKYILYIMFKFYSVLYNNAVRPVMWELAFYSHAESHKLHIKVWEIYNGKSDVVSFVIKPGRKLTISVKFEVNVKKWGRGNCFCCFLNISWKFFRGMLMDYYLTGGRGNSFCCFLNISWKFFRGMLMDYYLTEHYHYTWKWD
jgi:hypothetical protein